jgi:uncharacterized membrane protein
MAERKRRSIVKTLSWRFVSIFVTGGIVWLLTGKLIFAVQVGLIDLLIKLFIYYLHERIWNKISYGRLKPPDYEI